MIWFLECFLFNQKQTSSYNPVMEIIYQIGSNAFYPHKQGKIMSATLFISLFGFISLTVFNYQLLAQSFLFLMPCKENCTLFPVCVEGIKSISILISSLTVLQSFRWGILGKMGDNVIYSQTDKNLISSCPCSWSMERHLRINLLNKSTSPL